jgi:hypothetical protein
MGLTGFNLARRLAEQEAAPVAASLSSAPTDAPSVPAPKPKRRRKPTPTTTPVVADTTPCSVEAPET